MLNRSGDVGGAHGGGPLALFVNSDNTKQGTGIPAGYPSTSFPRMDLATSAGASVEHAGTPAASFQRGRRNLTQRRQAAETQKGKEREAFTLATASGNPGPPSVRWTEIAAKATILAISF